MTTAREQRVLEGLKEGARYVWQRRPLRLAVLLAFVVSTLGQAVQYIASALSERLYHSSGDGNAGLLTALGIGALISSGTTMAVGDRIPRSRLILGALVMFAAAMAILPITSSYFVGQVGYFFAGAAQVQIGVALNTLLQGNVPDEFRGRAISFYLLGTLAGIPLGTQVLGSLGDAIGFRLTMALDAGLFVAALSALVAFGWWRDLDATAGDIADLHRDHVVAHQSR